MKNLIIGIILIIIIALFIILFAGYKSSGMTLGEFLKGLPGSMKSKGSTTTTSSSSTTTIIQQTSQETTTSSTTSTTYEYYIDQGVVIDRQTDEPLICPEYACPDNFYCNLDHYCIENW